MGSAQQRCRLGDLEGNGITVSGFTQRKGGKWKGAGSNIGILWDINDTILGYQGEMDAIGREFITKFRDQHIHVGYSLGALRSNNLVRGGYAASANLYSLPFGNIRAHDTSLQNGSLDIVNGGRLGAVLLNFGSVISSPSWYNVFLNHKLETGYNVLESHD